MAFDAHSNFGYSTVAVAPAPPLAGLSLTVQAGQGALFPAAPFNCTVWPANVQPLASNAEIVRVTAVVGDVLTIVRAQEGTAAIAIDVGFQIANTTSVKVFTDIENAIPTTFVSNISAGAQSASGPIVFANANGITFDMNAGTVTAQHNAITQQSTQPVAASASNGSFLFSTLGFSNANNVTFGTSAGSIITASVAAAGAASVNFSAGTTSNNLASITFANSNGITFGLNAGTITASHNALTSQSNQAASASNGSFTFQTLGFSNANGVTFGTSAGSIVTASVGAGVAAGSISAGTTSVALGQAVFSNSNNITFGLNGSTITASASNAQSTQPVAASASNGSFLFSTLAFSNANNVTFGTSAGSIITASVATAAAGNSINFSAGTQSSSLGSVVFSNSNGVSFGLSNGTITASIGSAGADTLSSYFRNLGFFTTISGATNASASVIYFHLCHNLTFTQFGIPLNHNVQTVNNATSGGINFSQSVVLLSRNGDTLNSIASTTQTNFVSWNSNNTGGIVGVVMHTMPLATSLSAGEYWILFQNSTNATGGGLTGAATSSLTNSIWVFGPGTVVYGDPVVRFLGASTSASQALIAGQGLYSGTTNITQVAMSNITCNGTAGQRANLVFQLVA